MIVLSRSTTKFLSSCKSLCNIDYFHQSFHHLKNKHKKKHYHDFFSSFIPMIASRCLICYFVPWHFFFILWLNVQNNYLEEKEQMRGSFFKGRKFCRKKDRVNVTGKFSFHGQIEKRKSWHPINGMLEICIFLLVQIYIFHRM